MTESANLESWLKENKLNELLPILKENDVEDLSDLTELDGCEIDEFIETLNISAMLENKFKTAISTLKVGSDDDCYQEAFIDPLNKDRLQPIWNADIANADFIKCVGSLRIEFCDKKLTEKVEFCHGTATVIHIDEKNCCQALTAAHNGYQLLRKCPGCDKKTITPYCTKCQTKCDIVKPLDLMKAKSITFYRRCTLKRERDPSTNEERVFGDPIRAYHVNDYIIRKELYEKHASGKAGYDLCMMTFHCDGEDAKMYRKICADIKLVFDPTFGESKSRLHIFGYPGNKGYVDQNSQKMMHQMYGMSTGVNGNQMKVEMFRKTKKQYVINSEIDTEPGMSGSAIWSISGRGMYSKFIIYAIHSGGKQTQLSGMNYGTFLDRDNIKWIEHIQSNLLLSPGFNTVASIKREYIVEELKENKCVSIKTTIISVACDEKKQYVETKEERRDPEKLFADDNHKIILVCGKTGSGKTTVINSMMNYIFGIEMDDKFRLKLIEEEKKIRGNADSHTDHICSYSIKKPKGGNIDYDLTIIDTPGFGDTRGITKDKKTLKEFKYIFEKILTKINGICFIVKAADNVLDAMQTYVFNNMLNLWGKNVADNIFILMTFADNARAGCHDALDKNEVLKTCKHRFKMNCSAFTDNPLDEHDILYQLYWEMGMECFVNFFCKLDEIEPQPIEQSRKVLIKREQIQTKMHHLFDQFDIAAKKQNAIDNKESILKSKKDEVNAGKKIVWTWPEVYCVEQKIIKKKKMENWNDYAFSCKIHKKTCHQCYKRKGFWITLTQIIYNAIGKPSCLMTDDKDNCTICGCHYSKHDCNIEYIEKIKLIEKSSWEIDFDEKEKEHQDTNVEKILKQCEKQKQQNFKDAKSIFAMIQKLQNELEGIALRPQLTTVDKYIDQLIKVENEKQNVDADKIRLLKKIKKQEDVIVALQKNSDFDEIFL